MTFPAGYNAGTAQTGPNYDCLGSEPNPAWFFMQIATSGPITVVVSAANDVDFISWGPFPSLTSTVNGGVCNNLNSTTEVPTGNGSNGCSYSASNTETLIITNAVAGQFYLLLVTNYSNSQQNVNLTQTNANSSGAGTTNCGIICTVTPVSSGPICPGGTATISATTGSAVTSFAWSGPGGFSSSTNLTNVITNNLVSGTYTLQGTTSTSTCQALTTITVIPLPIYSVSPVTTTICENGSFIATANIINPILYNYQWSGPVYFSSPNGSSTLVKPPLLSSFTPTALSIYTLVVSPVALYCPFSTTLSVQVNNPSTPTLTMPPALCNTSTITSVNATPAGGTWFGNPLVNSLGIVTPYTATAFGTFTVGYSYMLGACSASNTGNISISQFNSAALTGSVPLKCVQDAPVNLLSVVLNTLGIWSGVGVSNNYFNPMSLPTNTYLLNYLNPSTPYPGVCPATNSIIVWVYNPPTPTISPIAAKCNNSPTVALSANPSGGVWSGNPGISATGIESPALSTNVPGINTVIYTAGQGTCVASTSANFQVGQFHSAALSTYSLSICDNTSPINLMSLVNSTVNGSWSTDSLGLVGTYTFNPANLTTSTHTLVYQTYSTPNPSLCPDLSHLYISVLNPIQPAITAINPVCSADAAFLLSVSPATGSFVPSLYLSSAGLFTPSLSAVGANPVQYVIGTSTCNAIDTKLVNVEAFVPATIYSTLPDQCNTGQVVNLSSLTTNTLGIWSGYGVLGTSFNPAASGVGPIVLTYKTASSPSGLCPDQQNLTVNVYSLAIPSISQEGPFCNSHAPIRLIVSPLGGVFSGLSSTGVVDVQGWFNPSFATIGGNIINYSVSSGPCQAYSQATIVIEAFVSAAFSQYAGPFCRNDAPVNLNGLVQNPGGAFSGPGVSDGIFDPSAANIGSSNYITYQTHSTPDQDLCPDKNTIQVTVNAAPQVSILRDVPKGCEPVQVTFYTPSVNNGRGQWNLGDGSQPQDGLSVIHTYTAPGTYSVVFNYWDPIGCSTQAILGNAVDVLEVPDPAFSYFPNEQITIAQPDVQFTNQTPDLGKNTYSWQIADFYTSTDVNPSAVFSQAGEYLVSLTATNVDGCSAQVSKRLIVKPDFNVFIPNTFTPNFDGLNDVFSPVFSPYGIDPKTFEMEIFDRWSNSLYHSSDITKGWDGTLQNKGSEPMKQDVYVYKIKYKDLEGKIYTNIGNVTLIK